MSTWGRKFFVGLWLGAIIFSLTAAERTYRDVELRLIARTMYQQINEKHYRDNVQPLTLSQQLFDQYFDTLDPARIFFTQEDREAFADRRDRLISALQIGDADFGFILYRRYQQRFEEFQKFATEMLKEPIDFSVDEEFNIDRTKSPWPQNSAEQRDLWRRKVKNDLLYYRLLERTLAEHPENAAKTAWDSGSPQERLLAKLRDLVNAVNQRTPIDILSLYLDTLARVYGPHSGYASPVGEEDFDIRMRLSLIGIGATLTSDGGLIKVVSIVPGGPADRDGKLKVGDRIISVVQENGETVDLIDMPVDKAVRHIRGELGSKVTLVVLSGEAGRNSVPKSITIVREKVDLVESMAKGEVREIRREDGAIFRVGVIILPSFYIDFDAYRRQEPNARRCSTDVIRIVEDFKKQAVDAIVIDLRKNGGGSLQEAIRLAGLFFKQGPVVQLRDRNRQISILNDPDPGVLYTGPLVVLTSKLSASASEIFASALQDCQRALVVGDSRTFGKGTVLEISELNPLPVYLGLSFPAGMLTCENAMFFRTSGSSVQQLGIEPDIQLPSITEELEIGEMFLPHHLPWDSITPANRPGCNPELASLVPVLTARSAGRIAADPEYVKLKKEIALLRDRRERKTVSLNEKKRWAEYQEEKLVADHTDQMMDEEKRDAIDPVLGEAVNIAADLAELSGKNP